LEDPVRGALEGQVKVGGKPRRGTYKLEQLLVQVVGPQGAEAKLNVGGHPIEALAESQEAVRPAQVPPVAGQIDTRQDDFPHALLNEVLDPPEDFVRREAPARTPDMGDDAERAEDVTSVVNLQVCPSPVFPKGGWTEDLGPFGKVRRGDVLREQKPPDVPSPVAHAVSHHEVGSRRLKFGRGPLGVTSRDDDPGPTVPLEAADELAGLPVALVSHRAGLQDNDICLLGPGNRPEAELVLEVSTQGLGFVLADLTAHCHDVKGLRTSVHRRFSQKP
jgi:hypothetical protein